MDDISFTGRFDHIAKGLREVVKENPEILAPVVSQTSGWVTDVTDFFLTLFGLKEPD